MKLTIINSNSQGNCYLLQNEKECLIIECGVRFDFIKKAMKFNFMQVVGCIVTHAHKDHCFAVQDLLRIGVPVYATQGTHQAMQTSMHHRAEYIEKQVSFKLGGFTIMAFPVKHDCADPVGFYITHSECGNVLFLTDTFLCEYTFPRLNNILIEANYSQEIIDRRLKNDKLFLRDRVIQSHMEIKTTLGVLRANDLRAVNNIVLIHLSDGNSDAAAFESAVLRETGKTVTIARPNTTIDFNINPF